MTGFKVISLTCDGVGSNRKFFKLHGKPEEYKECLDLCRCLDVDV